MAEKALNLHQQIRENAQELGDFLHDLNKWEDEIKQKDEDLKKTAKIDEIGQPIRSSKKKKQKRQDSKKNKVKFAEDIKEQPKQSRISSYDYDAWSKFDVDTACKNVDENEGQNGGDSSSSEEEEEEEEVDSEALFEAEERRRKQKSEFEKEKGNMLFKEGKYEAAINRYTIACNLDPLNSIIYANRAIALIKVERFAAAEADCSKAMELDPTYAKAVARRAIARTKLKKYKEAKEDQEYLLELQPNNRQAKTEIEKLEKKNLKRIVIEEIGSDEEDSGGKKQPLKEKVSDKEENNKLKTLEKKKSQAEPQQLVGKCEEHAKDLAEEFAVPKSPVQFETDFKKLKKNPEQFNRYFQAIPPKSYKSLFHHSMDEVLPLALNCLHKHYLRDNKEYWEQLSSLTEVPRFEMALMFLNKDSKNGMH
eukprot:gene2408-18056_t